MQKTHVVSTQTDIKEENSDDAAAVASELPPPTSASEAEWQARLEDAKTEVAENLKRQFEEEKDKALKDLTERVRCYSASSVMMPYLILLI